MVNEEKVHIMTQIALDETKKCKDQLHEGGYYKSDYIRSHTISAVWNITVSYLLVLFLIALYFSDYLFVNVVRLNYLQLGIMIGGHSDYNCWHTPSPPVRLLHGKLYLFSLLCPYLFILL